MHLSLLLTFRLLHLSVSLTYSFSRNQATSIPHSVSAASRVAQHCNSRFFFATRMIYGEISLITFIMVGRAGREVHSHESSSSFAQATGELERECLIPFRIACTPGSREHLVCESHGEGHCGGWQGNHWPEDSCSRGNIHYCNNVLI